MTVTPENILDIEENIANLSAQRMHFVGQLQEKYHDLSSINAIIKQLKLKKEDYSLQDIRRNQILQEKATIDAAIFEYTSEIKKKSALKDRLKNQLKNAHTENITEELTRLRDHYMKFSADKSRISSMRVMGSEIANELEKLIKKLNS